MKGSEGRALINRRPRTIPSMESALITTTGGTKEEVDEEQSLSSSTAMEMFHSRFVTLVDELNIPYQLLQQEDGNTLIQIPRFRRPPTTGVDLSLVGGGAYTPLLESGDDCGWNKPLLTGPEEEEEDHDDDVLGDEQDQHGETLSLTLSQSLLTWRGRSSRPEALATSLPLGGYVLGTIVFIFVVAAILLDVQPTPCESGKPLPPVAQRIVDVFRCATTLSPQHDDSWTDDHSNQVTAAMWFVYGAGRNWNVTMPDCTHYQSSFATMFSILMIRESLHITDPSWNSLTRSDVCHWSKIHCTADGVVDGLGLNHANVTGSLPTEWYGTGWITLDLYSNPNLTGTIPTQLGRLTSLQHLRMQQTGLEGTIPTELGYLTNLKELLLDATQLTGSVPNELCQIPSLHNNIHVNCDRVQCTCCGCLSVSSPFSRLS